MVYAIDLPVFAALAAATAAFVASVVFTPSESRGMVRTGEGIKVMRVGSLELHLYFLRHEMRRLPPVRSRDAFIDADVDKRFVLRMLRDADGDLLREAFRDALLKSGWDDAARLRVFLSAVRERLKAGAYVSITYDATRKVTTLAFDDTPGASVEGYAFMRAVWGMWLGKDEAPALADALTGKTAA